MIVEVRPATAGDSAWLLALTNDPSVRAASFHVDPITPADHERWLATRLVSNACRLMIGSEAGAPVGQVRFELDDRGVAEVGISLLPAVRGRGLGLALLQAAIAASLADTGFGARAFVARVRLDNAVSLRLFRRAGFLERGSSVCDGTPCAVLELAT